MLCATENFVALSVYNHIPESSVSSILSLSLNTDYTSLNNFRHAKLITVILTSSVSISFTRLTIDEERNGLAPLNYETSIRTLQPYFKSRVINELEICRTGS